MNHLRSYRKRGNLITESKFENKNIINVDIQPEYEEYIKNEFNLFNWVKFINKTSKSMKVAKPGKA